MKRVFLILVLMTAAFAAHGALAAPVDPDTNPDPCDYDQGCGDPGTPPPYGETPQEKIIRCSTDATWDSSCPNPRPSSTGHCGIWHNPSSPMGGYYINWDVCFTQQSDLPSFVCRTQAWDPLWPWGDAHIPEVKWHECWWNDGRPNNGRVITFGSGYGTWDRNRVFPRVPGCTNRYCWNPDGGEMFTASTPPTCQAVGCTDREQFIDSACPTQSGAECECRPDVPDGISIPVGASLAETVVSCVVR